MIIKPMLFMMLLMPISSTEPDQQVEFDGITVETEYFVYNDRQPEEVIELLRETFEVRLDNRTEILKILKMPKYKWQELSSKYRYLSIVSDGTYLYSNGGPIYKSFKVFLHNEPLNVK